MDVNTDIAITDISTYMSDIRKRVEAMLDKQLALPQHRFTNLVEAMRYAVLGGGKRIRAALVYSLEDALDVEPIVSDHIAAAIEMIHAFSLIHDDLPALDNDSLRRGKPACHIAYGEALAILAGDALIALSFQVITDIPQSHLTAEKTLKILSVLKNSIGVEGMAGGQAMEFSFDKYPLTVSDLEKLYQLKTGILLAAALKMMVLASPLASDKLLHQFEQFGFSLGLAFQLQDDLLEMNSKDGVLGKPNDSDIKNDKQTLAKMLGTKAAHDEMNAYWQQARQLLVQTHLEVDRLDQLVNYIVKREF